MKTLNSVLVAMLISLVAVSGFASRTTIPGTPTTNQLEMFQKMTDYYRNNPPVQHDLEQLLLDLTTETTYAPAKSWEDAQKMVLNPDWQSTFTSNDVFFDVYSGFQAYRIHSKLNSGKEIKVYAFAATQLFERSGKVDAIAVDFRDWLTNLSYGRPQYESRTARIAVQSIIQDALNGEDVYLSGQSLGGMLSDVLGYVALYDLLQMNKLEAMENIHILNFATPGMADAIEDFIRRHRNVPNYKLERQIVGDRFRTIFYDIDMLPHMGSRLGSQQILDSKPLLDFIKGHFTFPVPYMSENLETHIYPGLNFGMQMLGNYPITQEFENSKQVDIAPWLKGIFNQITYSMLNDQFYAWLAKNGTAADWQRCYDSGRWKTNLSNKCKSKDKLGCTVGSKRTQWRTNGKGTETDFVRWCLPLDQ